MKQIPMILTALLLLAACSSDEAPCGNSVPAVRVHFSFDGEPAPLTWDDLQPVRLYTNDGTLGLTAPLTPVDVGASRAAIVVLPYPTGTTAGPATVSFVSAASAVSPLATWQSDVVAFSADPAACVDVDVPVHFVDGSASPDAGAPDAGAPDAAP
jgi:hypothetical protein